MTEYDYQVGRGQLRLTIRGHAGAGCKGEDIVCSAISMAARILETGVDMAARDGWLASHRMEITDGKADILVVPREEHMQDLRYLMDCVVRCLDRIAAAAPEFLRVRNREGDCL